MGFFSDLKEDLSQAVNELMPEEEQTEVSKESEEEMLSLEEMLQNIDSVKLPEEAQEEESTEAVSFDVNEEELKGAEAQESEISAEGLAEFEMSKEELTKTDFSEAEMSMPEEETAEEDELAAVVEAAMTEPKAGENRYGNDDMEMESMLEDMISAEAAEENKEESKGAEKIMDSYTSRTVSNETAVITEGMTITGDLVSEGSADIIGCVNGNIDLLGKLNITGHINGNSKASEIYAEGAKINGEIVSEGAVKIGASSVIIGNITATSAAIAGAVKGDIDVKGPVVLDASAIVMGNIKSKSVQINNGAVIEGMCSQCYADVSPTSFFDDYKPEVKKTKQK